MAVTTIQISTELKDFLNKRKLCEREPYDEAIKRIFKECGLEVPA